MIICLITIKKIKNKFTEFLSSFENRITQGRMIRELRDCEWSTNTVITIIHGVCLKIILAPDEIWKDILIRPSYVTQPRPVIVILSRAPYIHHAIHNAGSTQNLNNILIIHSFAFCRLFLYVITATVERGLYEYEIINNNNQR